MKACIMSAVAPLVVDAKQHFRPDAEPISGEMCFMFKSSKSSLPATGASDNLTGPEVGIEGLFQACSDSGRIVTFVGLVFSGSSFGLGAPPMIPPSMKLMEGAADVNKVANSRAERGEMALRSR